MRRHPWLLVLTLAAACSDGGSSLDAAPPPPDAYVPTRSCTPAEVESDVFPVTCTFGQCHGGPSPIVGLDLESPGAMDRMRDAASANCPDRILLAPGDPGASLLFEKIQPQPTCGGQMPSPGNPLSLEEVNCVRTAIASMK